MCAVKPTITTTTAGNISKSKISNLFDWCLQRTKTWRDSITSSHDSIDSGDRSIDLIDCTQSPTKNLLNRIEKVQYLPSNNSQPVDPKVNLPYPVPLEPDEQTPSFYCQNDDNHNDDDDVDDDGNGVDDGDGDENDYLIIVSNSHPYFYFQLLPEIHCRINFCHFTITFLLAKSNGIKTS